jgi:hypothetical protein
MGIFHKNSKLRERQYSRFGRAIQGKSGSRSYQSNQLKSFDRFVLDLTALVDEQYLDRSAVMSS